MKWYIAKLIYNIICGEGNHIPQFDEQLRLICAQDDLEALTKAATTGLQEEDIFVNNKQKLVHWKFLAVTELLPLNEYTDGAEVFSRIIEQHDAHSYMDRIKATSTQLHESCREPFYITE